MTIKEIMKMLSKTDKDTLMTAFESGAAEYIQWSPGRFLGVNINSVPHLTIEQQAGNFQEGKINVSS